MGAARRMSTGFLCAALTAGVIATTGIASAQVAPASVAPSTPPAQICDTAVLNGPSQPPAGALRVDPGVSLSSATQAAPPGTTFWLAPGTHRLGSGQFDQVIPKANNVYIGGPGAVLDGQGVNLAAFTGGEPGVSIRYLTIQNFAGPDNQGVVNQGGGPSWTIEYTTIRNNRGSGLLLGDDNVVRYSCITANGQYGVIAYTPDGSENITVDHNELSHNVTGNYPQTCGCSGATKFFQVRGARITNNWVHHNKNQALWADTNAVGFLIEGNYINDNEAEGIFYEASYNAYIHNNTLKRNALGKGRVFAARNDPFPVSAIYISDAGGDSRVYDRYGTLEISGNVLEDNWGGVVLWEDPDRFCNTASPATGYCPLAGSASLSNCVPGTISMEPYRSDCRWRTQNVWVHHNDFRIDKVALGCIGTQCGQQGLFSTVGTSPEWSPYKGHVVADDITFRQNNRFTDNTYGSPDWRFSVHQLGKVVDAATWQAAPFSQDVGSTIPGAAPSTTTTSPSTTTTTVPPTTTTVTPSSNALDANTSGLESSLGAWSPWYSSTVSHATTHAHTGARSLQVRVDGSFGWGAVTNNWPGFATTAGTKSVSFWAMSAETGGPTASLRLKWRDSTGADLRTDVVTTPALGTTWQQATATVTAPSGTASVGLELVGGTGTAGNTLYFDDFVIS